MWLRFFYNIKTRKYLSLSFPTYFSIMPTQTYTDISRGNVVNSIPKRTIRHAHNPNALKTERKMSIPLKTHQNTLVSNEKKIQFCVEYDMLDRIYKFEDIQMKTGITLGHKSFVTQFSTKEVLYYDDFLKNY